MRPTRIAIITVLAFALGVALTFVLVRRPAESPVSPGHPDRKVLYWYDPMAPQQHFNAPGKSPLMDMQLLPKYADEAASGEGTVRIDPRLTQNLGVRTARVERGSLARTLHATGVLAFDERTVTVVQGRVAGLVEKLWVRAPLGAVKRGEPLVTLIAPDWTAAEDEYLSLLRARSGGLETLRSAARQRLLLIGMDEAQIRSAERAGQAQARITISAPRDGVVTDLAVREGATVAAGTPLMTISGLDTIWINVAVAEADSGRVMRGAKIKATLPAFPAETFDGAVEALLPELDAATRTHKARIVLANPAHRMAPGMFASVEISSPASPPALLVPSEAVITTGTRNVVIVDDGQGRFRAQEIRVGDEASDKTSVLDGLREGEAVVLSGQFLIDSEASLTGTLARLGSSASSGSAPPQAEAPSAPTQHAATGSIARIDGDHWTIATDGVPSLDMSAMTMAFRAPARAPAIPIGAGRRVSFSFFRNAQGEFEISQVAVLDAPSAKGEKP